MLSSELILNPRGSIYHLDLAPGEVAEKMLWVGDPGRVKKVAQFFDNIELEREKREFRTITGSYRGERMTVLSTGIGTDNIDIVINEIDAVFNIDFSSRQVKRDPVQLKIMRLGTSGSMQEDVPVESLINTRWAIGGDGLGHYYQLDNYSDCQRLATEADAHLSSRGISLKLPMYGAEGSAILEAMLAKEFPDIRSGITFTAGGFYGPQGRGLDRIPIRIPGLPEVIADFGFEGYRVLNMEMEAAAISSVGKALGHETATLCVVIANRRRGEFTKNPAAAVEHLITQGLEAMRKW